MRSSYSIRERSASHGNRTEARRIAVARLIRGAPVSTQDELRRLLSREGFATTQGTLSRDLARLGARRVARPEGGTMYELEERPLPGREAFHGLAELVRDITHNDSTVVVLTRPGAASAVARVIDEARPKHVLGTLAGDDTVFIAPALRTTPAAVAHLLRESFGLGVRQ